MAHSHLVGGRVGKDGLGVDSSLVGECTEASDGVVEGNRDLDGLGDEVLEVSQHGEVVLGLDVLGVDDVHAGDESSEGLQAARVSGEYYRARACNSQ